MARLEGEGYALAAGGSGLFGAAWEGADHSEMGDGDQPGHAGGGDVVATVHDVLPDDVGLHANELENVFQECQDSWDASDIQVAVDKAGCWERCCHLGRRQAQC